MRSQGRPRRRQRDAGGLRRRRVLFRGRGRGPRDSPTKQCRSASSSQYQYRRPHRSRWGASTTRPGHGCVRAAAPPRAPPRCCVAFICYAWPWRYRLRRCARVAWPRGSNLVCVIANCAETAVEFCQRRPARSKPRPARGPASPRCSPRAMLGCYEPTGQPNGSLSHADQRRGSLAGNAPRGGAARGVMAARDETALRGGASSQPTSRC